MLPSPVGDQKCCRCGHRTLGAHTKVTAGRLLALGLLFASIGRSGGENIVVDGRLCHEQRQQRSRGWSATVTNRAPCCSADGLSLVDMLMFGKGVAMYLAGLNGQPPGICDTTISPPAPNQQVFEPSGLLARDIQCTAHFGNAPGGAQTLLLAPRNCKARCLL